MPPSAKAAPARAPTRQCPELQGSPRHSVNRFQTSAPITAAASTASAWSAGTATMLATVAATAVPSTTAPTTWKTAATATALPGRIAPVTTGTAMALPASCTPFTMLEGGHQHQDDHQHRSPPHPRRRAAGWRRAPPAWLRPSSIYPPSRRVLGRHPMARNGTSAGRAARRRGSVIRSWSWCTSPVRVYGVKSGERARDG